ncbi:zinc finger protein [Xylariales sp. PMI_506]|nr:zinc finger protein [Xylariales sp. PMI_506]
MPAVLRPTEHSSKKMPARKGETQQEEAIKSNSSSFISLPGLSAFGKLNRRSTGDSGSCVDGEWDLTRFPKPTAQPTRQHWKPDHESAICDEPSCMRHFNYWTRRHHCRRCGNIFCDSHSAFDIPLDQDANYNPKGTISRACSHCYTEFQAWRSRTNSTASIEEEANRTSQTAPSSPVSSSIAAVNGGKGDFKRTEVAASVPTDWNWSTF